MPTEKAILETKMKFIAELRTVANVEAHKAEVFSERLVGVVHRFWDEAYQAGVTATLAAGAPRRAHTTPMSTGAKIEAARGRVRKSEGDDA